MFRSLVFTCTACLLIGCGGKPPEAKAPPQPATPTATVVAEDPPDLSPVARPAEVVAFARLSHPKTLVDTIAKWGSLPVGLEDALPQDAQPLARAIAWDAPVEALVALNSGGHNKVPLAVASVGVTSLDNALHTAEAMQLTTRKLAPGVYRIGDFADASCVVAVSLGSSPARLVCGNKPQDVDALLPYATRGFPTEPLSGADFELTVEAKAIQERYSRDVSALRFLAGIGLREIALDNQRFDSALSDAIYGGVDEVINLFNDLDRIHIEGRVDQAGSKLTSTAELQLKGDSSWTAGTLAAMKPVALPADLPRLPPGTDMAGYRAAWPAERFAAISRIAGDLLEGGMEHEKLPPATRKHARHLLDTFFSKLPEATSFSTPGPRDATHLDTSVARFSEPADRVLAIYNDAFALFGDAAVKRWFKTRFNVDDKLWPKLKKSSLKLAGFKTPATLFEAKIDGKTWSSLDPKLKSALSSLFPASAQGGAGSLYVAVQADGPRSYVVFGDDTKEMARVMSETTKTEPGVPFLKPARAEQVLSTAFFTLSFFARAMDRSRPQLEARKAVEATPNHGRTPLLMATTSAKGSIRYEVEIPAAVIADISTSAVTLIPAMKKNMPGSDAPAWMQKESPAGEITQP